MKVVLDSLTARYSVPIRKVAEPSRIYVVVQRYRNSDPPPQ